MNEKEVKLNQAAVDIITNNTLSEMLPREQQAYALMVALELAKSEAARQYHSPSKQEGPEELPSDNECTDIAFDFGYGCDPPKGNKQQEDIHDAAVWGLKKMRDYIKQNYTLTKKQP